MDAITPKSGRKSNGRTTAADGMLATAVPTPTCIFPCGSPEGRFFAQLPMPQAGRRAPLGVRRTGGSGGGPALGGRFISDRLRVSYTEPPMKIELRRGDIVK